jgi:hypothetical protein
MEGGIISKRYEKSKSQIRRYLSRPAQSITIYQLPITSDKLCKTKPIFDIPEMIVTVV